MQPQARTMSMNILDRSAVDPTRRSVTIAANDRARSAPDLDLNGLRFDNYRRNPVVMWAHDSVGRSPSGGLPIGRTLAISRAPNGAIIAEFEFLENDAFAQRIRNAWDKGFLRAASISWLPLESRPASNGRLRDVRSELLEWSIVSIPADPDALRETHRRMLDSLLSERGIVASRAASAAHPNEPAELARAISSTDYRELTSALDTINRVIRGATNSAGAIGATPAHDNAPSEHTAANPAAAALADLRALSDAARRHLAGDAAPPTQRSPPANA